MTVLPLAVGVGVRSGVAADDVIALIQDALRDADGTPVGIFTLDRKAAEPGLVAAAAALNLPLGGLVRAALETASDRTTTRSEASLRHAGVPSVAETAALAGAGPRSRLVVSRRARGGATCAVAAVAGLEQ
ncbi:MAG TPA: cobalamin biosynthesis protein [Methylomirabilota bacterium]|nr:cobalamin biosynthesis protein [Methylomirabilota bacterium]